MHNGYREFKKYIQFLSLEDQLLASDVLFDELINNNKHRNANVNKKYSRIQELKKQRHAIFIKTLEKSIINDAQHTCEI